MTEPFKCPDCGGELERIWRNHGGSYDYGCPACRKTWESAYVSAFADGYQKAKAEEAAKRCDGCRHYEPDDCPEPVHIRCEFWEAK